MNFAASALHTNAGIREAKSPQAGDRVSRFQPILTETERAVHRREVAALREANRVLTERCDDLALRFGKTSPKDLSAIAVMTETAALYGVPVHFLKGPRRTPELIIARHHAIYEVARRCAWMSYPEMGRLFNRDHTSIMSALRKWPAKAKKIGIPVYPLGRERSGE